jgi:hypothetical protein
MGPAVTPEHTQFSAESQVTVQDALCDLFTVASGSVRVPAYGPPPPDSAPIRSPALLQAVISAASVL